MFLELLSPFSLKFLPKIEETNGINTENGFTRTFYEWNEMNTNANGPPLCLLTHVGHW